MAAEAKDAKTTEYSDTDDSDDDVKVGTTVTEGNWARHEN